MIDCASFESVGVFAGFAEALNFCQIKFLPDLAQRNLTPEIDVVAPAFEQLAPAFVDAAAIEGTVIRANNMTALEILLDLMIGMFSVSRG